MDQRYEKAEARAAAKKTIDAVQAERARLTAAYDAQSAWARFWQAFVHSGRYTAETHGKRQEETAKRIWFKAQCTEDSTVYLTDDECDAIMSQWGAK